MSGKDMLKTDLTMCVCKLVIHKLSILGIQPQFDRVCIGRLFDDSQRIAVEYCRNWCWVRGYAIHGEDVNQED